MGINIFTNINKCIILVNMIVEPILSQILIISVL